MDKNNYEYSICQAQYILQMRPVFNSEALFSDETENYVSPMEPDPGQSVTIRFRTAAHNVDKVYLISGPLKELMQYERTEGSFDYYRIKVTLGRELFRYYFEVTSGRTHCFYNKLGITKDLGLSHAFCICPILAVRFWTSSPRKAILTHSNCPWHMRRVPMTSVSQA